MSNPFKEYSDVLARCMITYQFIEEGLKFCLYRCHAIIQFRLWGLLPYEAPLTSVDDAALGRLVEQYKVFTKNEDLIKSLRSIKSHRDFCAHKGYLFASGEQGDTDFIDQKKSEIAGFLSAAHACIELLKPEMAHMDKLVEEVYAKLRAERAVPADIVLAPPLR